ncbi:hypothetical protein FRC12_008587 [Ceratobasidium sp. 428]|nr:hypothetical protein FRC12_008587 [Ceratobasidium sp. 428]
MLEEDATGELFYFTRQRILRTNINMLDEQEHDQLTEVDNTSEEDNAPAPIQKRARLNSGAAKPTQKKYVRGKQGGLEGLMKMPIEIFTEVKYYRCPVAFETNIYLCPQIAYLLEPGDLIALIRSNKFFRELLLRPSSIKMWRQAENNVPGLPACPHDMCEPQYAALLFSKYCTASCGLCGSNATARPDVDLRVRLCASCRDTELEELNPKKHDILSTAIGLVHSSKSIRPKKNKSEPRALKNSVFCLKDEVTQAIREQAQFRRTSDRLGLAKWEESRRAAVIDRRQHASRLMDYFEDVEASHEEELENIKTHRREIIVERLHDLGWTDEDMTFSNRDPEGKSWRALVDAPKPLTDRIWSNMLPKLTEMLEENRERNPAHKAKQRRAEHRAIVDQYLMDMRFNDHPFASILDALGVGVPPPPDLSGVQKRGLSARDKVFLLNLRNGLKIANPFPKAETMLEWDCLKDLSEMEMDLPEVETKLKERRTHIGELVSEWRARTETRLLEMFGPDISAPGYDVILTVKGSTDSTIHLPPSSRFLLRADTLFKRIMSGSTDHLAVVSGEKPPCYYPDFVSERCRPINLDIDRPHVDLDDLEFEEETNLDHFARDVEAEEIVKALLRSFGMPDVTHVELRVMGRRFACGRCTNTKPQSWYEIVNHYTNAFKQWNDQKDCKSEYATRHPIVFQNVHNLQLADDSKPLVQLLEEDNSKSTRRTTFATLPDALLCYLCRGTARPTPEMDCSEMMAHMQDWHNVAKPVEDIHYGEELYDDSGDKWHKKWDASHDAREAKTE